MKRLLLALALLLVPAAASAQCNGVFPAHTLCGNNTGASGIPGQFPASAIQGIVGGSANQIQYNNAGALGGLTDAQVFARVSPFIVPNIAAQTTTGTNHTFVTGDCGLLTRRSNSGTVMRDTLATTGLSANCIFTIKNVDTTAAYVINVSGANLDGSSTGNIILGVNQSASVQFDGTNFWTLDGSGRILTGPNGITFYVAASGGADTNDGLDATHPWATRQHAWNFVQEYVDMNSPLGTTAVTIQLKDGTYTDATMQAVGSLHGQSFAAAMTFQGNCTTPGNVSVQTNGLTYSADDKAMYAIRCQRLTTTLVGGNVLLAQHGGSLIVTQDKLEINGGANTASQFVAQIGANIVVSASYKILGGGTGCAWLATAQGNIIVLNTITIDQTTAGINYGTAWACATDLGYVSGVGLTYNGTSTGNRYLATNNSIVNSGGGGANFFSGNAPGTVSGGGIYE